MGFLEQAAQEVERESETLAERARKSHKGKVLAVAETASGQLVLCRESTRGVVVSEPGAKPVKRDKDKGTEKYLKRTSALADIAHAIESGLL